MLILTGNKAINFEQVFYFSVEVPMPQLLSMNGAKAYVLIAHRGSRADDPDSGVIKNYHTQEEAFADLKKIIAGYSSGAVCVNLDTN